jgi:hypothetical protein
MSAAISLRGHLERVHPGPAPRWLRALWLQRKGGALFDCPSCHHAVPLGIGVHHTPRSYRLQCVACAWRTPWFEELAGGRLVVVPIWDS